MMKLKYFLLGLGLLLIPSYSMAINTMLEPGIGEDLGGQNYCVVESNLGFVCTKTNNVLVSYGLDGNGALTSSYWWREDGLGFYTYNGNYPDRNLQGVITGFTFCEYDFIGNNSIKINDSLYWNNCFTRTYTYQEFKEYLSTHTLKKRSFWSFYINGGQGGPMFIFDEGAFRVGFGLGSSEYQNLFYGTYGLRNFNLAGDGLSVDYSNVGVKTAPVYVIGDNSSSSSNINSAQDLYDSYKALGYRDEMCYGGFSIDDLYMTGSSLRGIKVLSGATIFQLYNTYSGGVSFSRWWNDYFVDYSFYAQYDELEPFLGKSKGLIGLFMMQEIYFKGNVVDSNLLYSFCALSLTNSNVDKSKSPLDVVNDSVLEDRLKDLVGDIGNKFPSSGSALDAVVKSLSGYDNFEDVWSGAYNAINSLKNDFSGSGVLPTYIGLGFLAFCLLYLLKK